MDAKVGRIKVESKEVPNVEYKITYNFIVKNPYDDGQFMASIYVNDFLVVNLDDPDDLLGYFESSNHEELKTKVNEIIDLWEEFFEEHTDESAKAEHDMDAAEYRMEVEQEYNRDKI